MADCVSALGDPLGTLLTWIFRKPAGIEKGEIEAHLL